MTMQANTKSSNGLSATQISQRSNNPSTDDQVSRVEAQLDRTRSAIASLLAVEDDEAEALADAADKAVDAIAKTVDEVGRSLTRMDVAEKAASKPYENAPRGVDTRALASVKATAVSAARSDVVAQDADKLTALAQAAAEACAGTEYLVLLRDSTSEELDDALDGKVTENDFASEKSAVQELSSLRTGALLNLYKLAAKAESDPRRLARLERACLKIASARLQMSDSELAPVVAAVGRDRLPGERDAAKELVKAIMDARDARAPKSIAVARDQVLPQLRESFRLLAGVDGMSDPDYVAGPGGSGEQLNATRKPWAVTPGWGSRYGFSR